MTHSATRQVHINALQSLERISLLTPADKAPRDPHQELAEMALMASDHCDKQTRSVA